MSRVDGHASVTNCSASIRRCASSPWRRRRTTSFITGLPSIFIRTMSKPLKKESYMQCETSWSRTVLTEGFNAQPSGEFMREHRNLRQTITSIILAFWFCAPACAQQQPVPQRSGSDAPARVPLALRISSRRILTGWRPPPIRFSKS